MMRNTRLPDAGRGSTRVTPPGGAERALEERRGAAGEGTGADRRAEPRLPLDAPVVVRGRGRSATGRTIDASAIGLLVELAEPLSFLDHHVGLEVSLGDDRVIEMEADVVRRSLSESGGLLLALRLVGPAAGRSLAREAGLRPLRDYSKRNRPSRAKPRAPRPAADARRELHALAHRVLELALLEPEAHPPAAMTAWVSRLAAELGHDEPADTGTNRLLLRAIARLHRVTGADGAEEDLTSGPSGPP